MRRQDEIDDLRLDIKILRRAIDAARDRGVGSDDISLRACARLLHGRRRRLAELERAQAGSADKVAAMPDRLDQVTVSLNSGDITFGWDGRQALMRRLQHIGSRQGIRETFEAVGASRPVQLHPGQKVALLDLLENWSRDGAYEAMPDELLPLRAALSDDVNDA